MRGKFMRLRFGLLFLVSAVFFFLTVTAAHSANDASLKLKTGARGKICLNCHVEFQEKLKNAFVHTPVKNGDCTGCHNPHTSSHGKLLSADTSKICSTCHPAMVPDNARSAHKVVVDNNC